MTCRKTDKSWWRQPRASASHCYSWIFVTEIHLADSISMEKYDNESTVKTRSASSSFGLAMSVSQQLSWFLAITFPFLHFFFLAQALDQLWTLAFSPRSMSSVPATYLMMNLIGGTHLNSSQMIFNTDAGVTVPTNVHRVVATLVGHR